MGFTEAVEQSLQCPAVRPGDRKKKCQPCIYFSKPEGCSSGNLCRFCHVHSGNTRMRPSKAKRAAAKHAASVLDTMENAEDREEFAQQIQGENNPYLQTVVKKKLRIDAENARI